MTPPLSGQLYREVEHSVGRGRAVRPSDRQSVRGALGLAQERVSLTPALTWLYRSRADMGLARLHQAGALLVASLLLVLTAATGVHSGCNATCERDLARCMATQCAGVGRAACRRSCKPGAIRTLAYVVSECREDPAGIAVYGTGLRIRRGDREPISVWGGSVTQPTTPDFLQACRFYGQTRWGAVSMLAGPLQRL